VEIPERSISVKEHLCPRIYLARLDGYICYKQEEDEIYFATAVGTMNNLASKEQRKIHFRNM
jgi:hypothetical protein